MVINSSHFGLGIDVPFIGSNSRSFRPPNWPPPKDWVCIEDKEGNAVSRYGDHVWNFSPWSGKTTNFSFGDGPKLHARSVIIDPANAEILRQLVTLASLGAASLHNGQDANYEFRNAHSENFPNLQQ